jgi:thiamine-phosphate diphosphorylase
LLPVVERALDAGLPAVLFRDPDLADDEAATLARPLRRATSSRGARLLVHGRPALAEQVGADGLHLPAGAEPPPAPGRPLSLSAHDRAELARAGTLGAAFALLSPLFPTRSHPGRSALGVAAFRDLAVASPVPVLALGGITTDNAADARVAGAAGIACIDGILAAEDPAAAVRAFLEGGY